MNKYGKYAQEAWKETAPEEYARILDPEIWFRQLGEEAARRVVELETELAGPDPAEESYLEKVGRLNAAKLQAEEVVRAEMLTPDLSGQTEQEEETGKQPGIGQLLDAMRENDREDRLYWDEMARQELERR